jgi:hypothetical protein
MAQCRDLLRNVTLNGVGKCSVASRLQPRQGRMGSAGKAADEDRVPLQRTTEAVLRCLHAASAGYNS